MTRAEAAAEWRKINRQRIGYFRKYRRVWFSYYESQGETIRANVKDGKADPTANTFNTEDIERITIAMHKDIGVKVARQTLVEVEMTQKADDPQTVYTWEMYMAQYASADIDIFRSISDTGKAQAKRIIDRINQQAIDEGWGINEITDKIDQQIKKEWRIASKFNAERIARTETLSAANKGAMIGAERSSIPLKKIWLTAVDGRERQSHGALHLTERLPNERFANGLLQPLDKTSGNAGEIINCRCAVSFRSTRISPLKPD